MQLSVWRWVHHLVWNWHFLPSVSPLLITILEWLGNLALLQSAPRLHLKLLGFFLHLELVIDFSLLLMMKMGLASLNIPLVKIHVFITFWGVCLYSCFSKFPLFYDLKLPSSWGYFYQCQNHDGSQFFLDSYPWHSFFSSKAVTLVWLGKFCFQSYFLLHCNLFWQREPWAQYFWRTNFSYAEILHIQSSTFHYAWGHGYQSSWAYYSGAAVELEFACSYLD